MFCRKTEEAVRVSAIVPNAFTQQLQWIMKKNISKNTSAILVAGRCRDWFIYFCCSLISTTACAQQVILVPGTAHVPVNRIQAPGYIPPPPMVRRPWWFTVQTVSGPGAVMPVPRVTHYRPQVFRFPAQASVLAGKPITPPTSTFPSQWASAPPITPSAPVAQKPELAPPSSWAPSVGLPPPQTRQEPQHSLPPPVPPKQVSPSLATQPPPSGNWATIAINASEPQPNALAVTIPAEPGSLLAAQPQQNVPQKVTASAQPVSIPQPPAATPTASVSWWRCIGVTDGDTFTCLDTAGKQQKVRVSEIDAPELGQPYGRDARDTLAELVFGKSLAVVPISSTADGLVICKVSVDGKDLGREMVVAGAAWTEPQSESSLTKDQQDAKNGKRGLWSEASPTPPWEFRKATVAPWQQAA